ncbi:ferrous iron transport protein A [Enterovibrio norvegicus]|uniref:Ferrous iron transport protein A n=2 Tax=Enterovibrio norvegicus TaxID=188144 RepID=A0A1I5RPX3_9GAMM|nr:ferrous iron transport protein A [Enterovibrio norvegicus]TKF34457.1 ferrous iron transport protein A [Enterovibrio norvegicus]SFP59966.1 ferrous iron transport protein A [Enterovibrio norvegicus DSM 15893]
MFMILILVVIMKLAELKPGLSGRVTSLANVPVIPRKKLMAMGLLPDTQVTVVRIAPMGDPIQVRVRGCDIALRLSLAENIEVLNNAK